MHLSIHRPRTVILGLLLLVVLLAAVAMKTGVAHAASPTLLFPHLCADSPNVENCNATDPISEGCLADARNVDTQLAWHQGVAVGYVALRASASCHTYWVRSIAYGQSGVVSTLTEITYGPDDPRFFPGAGKSYPTHVQQPDDSIDFYTDMAFSAQPPGTAQSTFFFADGTSVTVHV